MKDKIIARRGNIVVFLKSSKIRHNVFHCAGNYPRNWRHLGKVSDKLDPKSTPAFLSGAGDDEGVTNETGQLIGCIRCMRQSGYELSPECRVYYIGH